MVSARIPPMIWAGLASAPRMVLPEELWGRFDSVQQDAVMAHELVHLKRRDHWVRRLEAVVLALFLVGPDCLVGGVESWSEPRKRVAMPGSCGLCRRPRLPTWKHW